MTKITKTQAKKRLEEALSKVQKVYVSHFPTSYGGEVGPVHTKDMEAIDKVIKRCLKRCQK